MPLTAKGRKIKRAMRKTYGAKKGEQVFYASQNAGRVAGTERSIRSHMQNRRYR